MLDNLEIIHISRIGTNSEGKYEYEFYFSEDSKIANGEFWGERVPVNCPDMLPYSTYYSLVKRLVTDIPFSCIQDNMCFSMKDCKNGCVALCWEDISNYEEYPEPYRIVIKYGEKYSSVRNNLLGREIDFIEDGTE